MSLCTAVKRALHSSGLSMRYPAMKVASAGFIPRERRRSPDNVQAAAWARGSARLPASRPADNVRARRRRS